MIPIRLMLKDFLSYSDPGPLDFSEFEVGALIGDNGAGKSALLDAMTFALFGAARGCEGGQNQDRLIRDGADETEVDFTFSLGGLEHRIVRRRTRKGKGDLNFLVSDGDTWTNLAGETLRETDARVASVLRMDYKTFTASAFFVQGRSEDFLSRLGPEQRKDVFVRLLDLESYERLEDAARSRSREAERRRSVHADRIAELEGSPAEVEATQAELAAAEKAAAELASSVDGLAAKLDTAQKTLSELETKEAVLNAALESLAETQATAQDVDASLASKRDLLADIDKLVARSDEVAKAVDEAASIREREAAAREELAKATEIDRRCAVLEQNLVAEEKTIRQRLRDSSARTQVLAKELAALDNDHARAQELEKQLKDATSLEDAGKLNDERLEECREKGARADAQLTALKEKLADIKERMALLTSGGAECPVCGEPLDAAHRAQAKKKLQTEAGELKTLQDSEKAVIDTARKEFKRCVEDGKRIKRTLAEIASGSAQREALLAKLERAPVLRDEATALEAQIASDEASLTDSSFGKDLRDELEALRTELAGAYDAEAHASLRSRLDELRPFEELSGKIKQATEQRTLLGKEIASLEVRRDELESSLGQRRAGIEELRAGIGELPEKQRRRDELASRLEELRRDQADRSSTAARLAERLETARRAAADLEAARSAEIQAAAEQRSYRRLTEAFGRGGIPDLIIDNALPELEEEANRILGALSDYEMSVHFQMEKLTKTGKPRDTFDVLVHHDGGVRDFSMFSGGEAFRIAFSVRLAMSKLLVRRAGARLETLVVDEGFGTQDPQGRERLVEALNLARTEFSKVLVITHVDDLKDLFGAQICVRKDPKAGSVFEVQPA
jgi:DNA repair protein SbcC/Rad50